MQVSEPREKSHLRRGVLHEQCDEGRDAAGEADTSAIIGRAAQVCQAFGRNFCYPRCRPAVQQAHLQTSQVFLQHDRAIDV